MAENASSPVPVQVWLFSGNVYSLRSLRNQFGSWRRTGASSSENEWVSWLWFATGEELLSPVAGHSPVAGRSYVAGPVARCSHVAGHSPVAGPVAGHSPVASTSTVIICSGGPYCRYVCVRQPVYTLKAGLVKYLQCAGIKPIWLFSCCYVSTALPWMPALMVPQWWRGTDCSVLERSLAGSCICIHQWRWSWPEVCPYGIVWCWFLWTFSCGLGCWLLPHCGSSYKIGLIVLLFFVPLAGAIAAAVVRRWLCLALGCS